MTDRHPASRSAGRMPSSMVLEEGAAPTPFPQISPNARGKEGGISTYGAAVPHGNDALTWKNVERDRAQPPFSLYYDI